LINRSPRRKNELKSAHDRYQKQIADLDILFTQEQNVRKSLLAGPQRTTSRAQLVGFIEKLKKSSEPVD